MDPNFVLHYDRKLTLYPEGLLRRDPNFVPQLYLYSTESMGANKFGLYFSQAVAASSDPNDQSVRAIDFLKGKYTSPTGDANARFAIDERAAKIYLGFVQKPKDRSDSHVALRIFDLDFDPVDHLGYRRIRIRSYRCYAVRPDPPILAVLGDMAICPVTGKLFGDFAYVNVPANSVILHSRLAEIEQPKPNDSVLRAKLSDHKFETVNASRSLNCRGIMFSKLNHIVLLYVFSDEPKSEKLMFVSYDTHLNLLRCLPFDAFDLAAQFFPTGVVEDSESTRRRLTMMVGRIHKYILFNFGCFVLAVKWPSNWYTGQHLPPVQISRVIDLRDFLDEQQVYEADEPPASAIMLTNTHLYILFALRDKPNEIKRLALSPRFKDYRQCANCGEVEKKKRRNTEGKRIAQFKVCRLCKAKNFHLFYLDPDNACHYCTDECQKKHWKIHKDMHKRSKLNRKTAGSGIAEIFE